MISIIKPEMFMSYEGMIVLSLYKGNHFTWFVDQDGEAHQIFNKYLTYPSVDEVIEQLDENRDFLEIALEHDAVEVREDDEDYLTYCLSYE